MRFSSVALAATVSAATVGPDAANVLAVTKDGKASTNNFSDMAGVTWAKGYGAGKGQASKLVEVDLGATPAAQDVTFSAVYTGDLTAGVAGAITKEESCGAIPAAAPLPTAADATAEGKAIATNKIFMAPTWTAMTWKGDEGATATEGAGTALTEKTAPANVAVVATAAADSTCTNSVTYTIPKDAKNVKVAALKEAGITMGDVGSYATVKVKQAKLEGCANLVNEKCPAGTAEANALAGGFGVYQGIKGSDLGFLWAVSIKDAAAADAAATTDAKKSATTLAIGAAAGLVAAAIA